MSFHLGNYTDLQRTLGRRAAAEADAAKKTTPEPAAPSLSDDQQAMIDADPTIEITAKGKPKRRSSSNVQKELAKVERSIAQLEGKLNELNDAMTVATIDQDVAAIGTLGTEFEKVQTELDSVYAEWEQLTEAAMELESV